MTREQFFALEIDDVIYVKAAAGSPEFLEMLGMVFFAKVEMKQAVLDPGVPPEIARICEDREDHYQSYPLPDTYHFEIRSLEGDVVGSWDLSLMADGRLTYSECGYEEIFEVIALAAR